MSAKLPTLDEMVTLLGRQFDSLPDQRAGPNLTYTLGDAGLAAFAVFFMQAPSFLAQQRDMQRQKGRNNAASLFGGCAIPRDPQIRNLLEPLAPAQLAAPYCAMRVLRPTGCARSMARSSSLRPRFTVSVAASRCRTARRTMPHTAITPVRQSRDAPGASRVLTLELECITSQDGQAKQECARNAAKRWLTRQRDRFGSHAVTYLGDDLCSHQPFCEQVRAGKQQHFIFTCKPDSPTTLYEEVALLNRLGAVCQVSDRHWTGRAYERWTYRYVNVGPRRAGARRPAGERV